ncbi:MAG: protein kinase [Thermoanaerobaculia bacterium]
MLPAGFRVGVYEIVSLLGSGGMGEVYRARDPRLGRDVAIKLLFSDRAPTQQAIARFRNEARAASALNHPAIVHIYDIGEVEVPRADGSLSTTSYIAMELIDGMTLRQRLVESVPPELLVDWLVEIAEGLAKAHDAGIVHRDLKPENVMIARDGYAKIVDFGLAKLREPAGGVPIDTASPTEPLRTAEGLIVGTAPYMSPEQLIGPSVDARSDIFAFGAIAFEAFAGRRPFGGATTLEVIHEIAYGTLGEIPDRIPARIAPIVVRCLEKDPGRRYPSAAEVAKALRLARAEGIHSAPKAGAMRAPSKRRIAAVAVTLVLLAAATGLVVHLRRDATPPAAARPVGSIAVLPFHNVRSNQEIDYLADGMTDSIIFSLSRLPGLRVMSRGTVFRFRDRSVTALDAGKALGVDAVLDGEIVQRDGRLIVRAELVSVPTGALLWGDRYDRAGGDALAIQGTISREIAAHLQRSLSAEDQSRVAAPATTNPEAYREYLKGRFFWNKRTAEGLQKAIEHFDAALDLDPTFALAWVGLGDSHALREQYAGVPSSENCPRALEAVRRALALDPSLPHAHASMGLLYAHCEWDWRRSEESFHRAIELAPDYPTVHHWYSLHLGYRLQFEQSLAEARRAVELDPLSPIVNNAVSVAYEYGRRYPETVEQSDRIIDMDPSFPVAHVLKARGLRGMGRLDEAIAENLKAVELSGGRSPEAVGSLGICRAMKGDRAGVREAIATLEASLETNPANAYQLAKIAAASGDRETAFRWLDRAREAHSWHLVELEVEPAFDAIRREPRFLALVREVGLE